MTARGERTVSTLCGLLRSVFWTGEKGEQAVVGATGRKRAKQGHAPSRARSGGPYRPSWPPPLAPCHPGPPQATKRRRLWFASLRCGHGPTLQATTNHRDRDSGIPGESADGAFGTTCLQDTLTKFSTNASSRSAALHLFRGTSSAQSSDYPWSPQSLNRSREAATRSGLRPLSP